IEALRIGVGLMERRLTAINPVQICHPTLQVTVKISRLNQMPVQTAVAVPFVPWSQFISHEDQLLSGLGVLVPEEQPKVGESSSVVSRHLLEKRLASRKHIIKSKRQNESAR